MSARSTPRPKLGRKLRLPIVLCPVGSLESFHPGGAEPVVKAAAEFGVAHMLSPGVRSRPRRVAKAAPNALRMFQLYVRGDAAWADDHVERAINNGYSAFCLTVDTAHYSRRERDLAKRHVTGGRRRATGRDFQMALDWRTVERMKSEFKIPFGIKGIGTAEDAKIALDHGVEIIYVSNHGGRQLDHGRGSIDVLPEVVEAVAGRAIIIVDGGFYRGTDIVKALALGANLVGLGRMQCYGLAAAGPGRHRAHARNHGGRSDARARAAWVTSLASSITPILAPRRRPMRRMCSRLSRSGNTRRIGIDTAFHSLVPASAGTQYWIPAGAGMSASACPH